jgi:hypothetical protein
MAITNTQWGNVVNLNAYMGESWQVDFVVKGKSGSAVPLNAVTSIKLQIKTDSTDSVVLLELALTTGLTVTGSSNEIISANKIMTIGAGKYYYDIQVVYNSTITFYPYKGILQVDQNTTR